MKIDIKELEMLRNMLNEYENEYGCVVKSDNETLNCACGSTCTVTCSTYCDGAGKGSLNMCWNTGYR